MRKPPLAIAAVVILFGMAATPRQAVAQPGTAASTTGSEEVKERASLPHSVVIDVIERTVGPNAREGLGLTEDQSKSLRAEHDQFEREVKAFLRGHAGGRQGRSQDVVPSRADAERRVLGILNKEQSAAVEAALRDAAALRVSERHAKSHQESHHESHQVTPSGESSSASSSSSSSESIGQHSSQSSHDSRSDRHTNSSQSAEQRGGSDKDSKSSSGKNNASNRVVWSSLSAKEQNAAVLQLLDQLQSKDRADLAKELGIELPPSR